MTNKGDGALPEKIADLMWQVWRAWRWRSHPVKQGQITPEQYWILHLLYHRGPHRVKDLASGLGVGSSTVTVAIKRMERNRLVGRQREKGDERAVTVYLTDQGQGVFQAWREERRRVLSTLFEPLAPDEKRELYHLLAKVARCLEEGGRCGECGGRS